MKTDISPKPQWIYDGRRCQVVETLSMLILLGSTPTSISEVAIRWPVGYVENDARSQNQPRTPNRKFQRAHEAYIVSHHSQSVPQQNSTVVVKPSAAGVQSYMITCLSAANLATDRDSQLQVRVATACLGSWSPTTGIQRSKVHMPGDVQQPNPCSH